LADRVVVHGEYSTTEFVERFGSKEKVVTVNHGDYEFFTDHCDVEIKYEPELLFFGRIRPYKGVERLIRAEERIAKRVDDFRITIAGNGPMPVDDDEIGERTVVLNRYISNTEVCELFSRCRAVVLPYTDASQTGIVPIAYSFRKPVVVTDVGGLPEVVRDGETGFIINNTDGLVDSLVSLLRSKKRAREFGDNGHGFKERNMDWEIITEDIFESYHRI
jgi:glycosyltransferase involved in cell wall biosynthesis